MPFRFMAFHYPKAQLRDDLLRSTERFGAAPRAQSGLLQLANFDDPDQGRIVAISLRASPAHLQAARERSAAAVPGEAAFAPWELRPREVFALNAIVPGGATAEGRR